MGKVKEWSVEKKDLIEKMLIHMWAGLGMDIPSNYEDIVQDCYEDVCETADPVNWHSGDVVIAFRRWIEKQVAKESVVMDEKIRIRNGGLKESKCEDYYFLFGEEVCDIYHDEGIEAAVKHAKKDGGYGLYHYNTKVNTPDEILAEADGWSDYAQLTKDEYEQF